MRLFSRLSGDDIFISYSRTDGSHYAAGLADKLTEKNFSCFIDRLGVRPDHDLPPDLVKRVRGCSLMVIVGTKKAAESEYVRQEINIFKQTGRTILPIDFNDNLGRAIWYEDIPGLATEIEKNPQALESGEPSPNVISFIEKSFNYTRRNQYMNRIFWTTAAMFVILLGLGIISASYAQRALAQAADARAEALTAQQEADAARNEKATALVSADAARKEAENEKRRANFESERAANQTRIADAKTKEADLATEKANEQTQKAQLAENQRKDAENKASAQEIQAKINLAENYYNIAETEAKTDSIRALPWLQKAIEAAPKKDARFEIYKLKALHLTQYGAYSIINTGADSAWTGVFSPQLDKVFIINWLSGTLWDLKKGVPLALPIDSETHKPISITIPVFSPNGKWAAMPPLGATPEEKGKGATPPCLQVWEIGNPQNHFKTCEKRPQPVAFLNIDYKEPVLPILPFDFEVNIRFSPDNNFVIADIPVNDGKQRKIWIWDVRTGLKIAKIISSDVLVPEPAAAKNVNTLNSSSEANMPESPTPSEGKRLNRLVIGKTAEANLLITIRNEEKESIAEIREISDPTTVKRTFRLKKYVDFIDVNGDTDEIFTISHDLSADKILRVWDIESGESRASSDSFKFNILGVSNSGTKLILRSDVQPIFYLFDMEKNSTLNIPLFDSGSDLSAQFTDDDEYFLVTKNVQGYLELTSWDAVSGDKVLITQTSPASHALSNSLKRIAFIAGGMITMHRMIPKEAYLGRRIKLQTAPGMLSYSNLFSSPDHKTFITVNTVDNTAIKPDGAYEIRGWDVDWEKGEAVNKWKQNLKSNCTIGDIAPDKNHFVVVQDGFDNYVKSYTGFTILDLNSGGKQQDISVGKEKNIPYITFDRSGSTVIALVSAYPASGLFEHEIRRWDSSSGKENAAPVKLPLKYPAAPSGLTRYGEYLIATNLNSGKNFLISRTDGTQNDFTKLEFSNAAEANLALLLLKQAEKINEVPEGLVATMNSDLSIEIRVSGETGRIINKKTGRAIIAPKGTFNALKISLDGRVILGIGQWQKPELWSAETGALITNRIGETDYNLFTDFTPDSSRVITASSRGNINTWFVGNLRNEEPTWLNDFGTAISGMEINDSLDLVNISESKLFKLRNDYFKRLQEAADKGDMEAKYILDNLKP